MAESTEITVLIAEWQGGSRAPEAALFDALYRDLHKVALQILRTERSGQTLGATALVHEAYLRFNRSRQLNVTNRTHFLALAARVMRRLLVDRARARRTEKRGADPVRVEQVESLIQTDQDADRIIAVDLALAKLHENAPRQCQLVELRYFAGYTIEESALILGISTRTARREWQIARTRLRGTIDGAM
jgi:RNA polymerase sigma factor (TIGR02999 family)